MYSISYKGKTYGQPMPKIQAEATLFRLRGSFKNIRLKKVKA